MKQNEIREQARINAAEYMYTSGYHAATEGYITGYHSRDAEVEQLKHLLIQAIPNLYLYDPKAGELRKRIEQALNK